VKGYCENDGNGKIVLRPERGKQADSTDEHCGPPPEAYAACENKTSGSQSQFVNPRGDTVIGICEKEGDKLVLRPDRPAKPDVRGKANVKRSGS
jgi:hypothetical protein